MAGKKCCIVNCNSCCTRREDTGVTYHKFPKNITLCNSWIRVTKHDLTSTNIPAYVCSRHFCKSDFKIYKDSKYMLKSDAVPSLFPWINENKSNLLKMDTSENKEMDLDKSKESDGENLEAIKKFIENQQLDSPETDTASDKKEEVEPSDNVDQVPECKDFDERLAVASSMMDMILTESEDIIAKKREEKTLTNNNLRSCDKGSNTMSISVGSDVEAKDFAEYWHQAKIVEVDYDEMEVLVHYDNESKKHDEWISVSSPRLRPLTASLEKLSSPAPITSNLDVVAGTSSATVTVKEEPKIDEKPKLSFVVGERCLARWRDNRRFMATINKELDNAHYEIVFDDGFQWTCPQSRLYKMKDSSKTDGSTVDTTVGSTITSAQSPIHYGAGPSASLPQPQTPVFHTHLFDPTRDYLGSKSERREMKRKLNIKEIFNIGQKRRKQTPENKKKTKPNILVHNKRKTNKNKPQEEPAITTDSKLPDAVASIIGTMKNETVSQVEKDEEKPFKEDNPIEDVDIKKENNEDASKEDADKEKEANEDDSSKCVDPTEEVAIKKGIKKIMIESDHDEKSDIDPVQKEEVKLEQFEKQDDAKHEEVIDRIKEVINKLEDGISKVESPKPEIKVEEEKLTAPVAAPFVKVEEIKTEEKIKKLKVKKGKKLRLLQGMKVEKQVEKVRSQLEQMKRQMEEMRRQISTVTEEPTKAIQEMPASYLLPGEWCCKWVNGQPVGKVSELEAEVKDVNSKPGLPRRSVQVDDKRLPPGWTKHMVRRSLGNSAGKWDVVLVSPENRRFHTKTDMRNFMEQNPDETLKEYENALMDYGVHLKLARRMGWYNTTPGGVDETPVIHLPAGTLSSTSPLVKRRKLSLKRPFKESERKRKMPLKIRMPKYLAVRRKQGNSRSAGNTSEKEPSIPASENPPLEDGYVYVGSLKVQIIENLLRCPAEGCFKNFRNNTLLKMHIKHYHRELLKMLGRTPKVLDLAAARTAPTGLKSTKKVGRKPLKTIKVKIPRPPKRVAEPVQPLVENIPEPFDSTPTTPVKQDEVIPRVQDSPKLRNALVNKPVKRPRVLLPVKRPELEQLALTEPIEMKEVKTLASSTDFPIEQIDFETSISTHAVIKPSFNVKKKEKSKVSTFQKNPMSEDDEWLAMTSDIETRSSFPRSKSPDPKLISMESNEEQMDSQYEYTDTGERVKIVRMKREEIINCHCGYREEDGLMVQCELCLCWQHALCHNIQREADVPDKYTCSICLNPRRGRRSQRFLHDQDRLYEGVLPGARAAEPLRRSHELAGNLLRVHDALHALRVKYRAATTKDHHKLYLWAKDWENGELNQSQEKLNAEYSDLNLMIGKENLPVRVDGQIDMQVPADENDRFSQRDGSLLGGLLSSPGGGSLDLPISTSELERLARSVQEEVHRVPTAPQPEAPIENSACRERLLRHIQRCQAVIDARLDSIEAQVAELESQDPSNEDDETPDYFPRTKQTIHMLMRDLDTMEELGVIT